MESVTMESVTMESGRYYVQLLFLNWQISVKQSLSLSLAKCTVLGGSLASIDSEYENSVTYRTLSIEAIRTAWIGKRADLLLKL